MITVTDVVKQFNEKIVLNNVSLNVSKNRIHGILGHNGAGKTTLIRIILGLINSNGGNVNIFGHSLEEAPLNKGKIGFASENLSLYSSLTVEENLLRFCKLKQIDDPHSTIQRILKDFKLETYANYKIKELSAGTKQRVSIARALLNKPELLILDEFLSNIDPEWRHQLKNTLKRLRDQHEITVLMTSHILSDIEELCDDVTIIKEGEIIFSDKLEKLYEEIGGLKLIIKTNDNKKAYDLLSKKYNIEEVSDYTISISIENDDDVLDITNIISNNNLRILEFKKQKPDLETVYLTLYGSIKNE